MHLWLRALFIVYLAVIIPTFVSLGVEGHPQARELEVKAAEQRWLDNENRSEVVQSILADDFVHVLPIGFISKDDHLAYLKQHPNAFSERSASKNCGCGSMATLPLPPELSAPFVVAIANLRELLSQMFSFCAPEIGWL